MAKPYGRQEVYGSIWSVLEPQKSDKTAPDKAKVPEMHTSDRQIKTLHLSNKIAADQLLALLALSA